jgi:uncharacterized protein YaiI (UPF0178 family)
MRVYIDADACPVTAIAEEEAAKLGVETVLLCDINHALRSAYSQVIVVDAGADSVDLALVNRCAPGDIVVTQDYGLAALALAKGAAAIHQSGMVYREDNIEGLLAQRYESKKARRACGKHHLKGPAKRTGEDDRKFREAFRRLLEEARGRDPRGKDPRGKNPQGKNLQGEEERTWNYR